jgi:hypothetical protein
MIIIKAHLEKEMELGKETKTFKLILRIKKQKQELAHAVFRPMSHLDRF